jgi:ABC-type transporter Mla maintaining outer membrane lipid asymmetry ATPase subunit MlaF
MLDIKALGKRFPAREGREPPPWIIQDLSFSVAPGELLTIVGPSGAGKSTLLNIIAQIETASAGEIMFDGERTVSSEQKVLHPGLNRRVGYVTQDDNLLPWRTTIDNVLFPREVQGTLDDGARARAAELIAAVGLSGFERYCPHELSGGMRKRAALARAMALDPDLLFCDEPSAGLDPITSSLLDDLILELRDSLGATMVMVTHELPSIFAIADNSVYLDAETRTMLATGDPKVLVRESPDPKVRAFLTRGKDDLGRSLAT